MDFKDAVFLNVDGKHHEGELKTEKFSDQDKEEPGKNQSNVKELTFKDAVFLNLQDKSNEGDLKSKQKVEENKNTIKE